MDPTTALYIPLSTKYEFPQGITAPEGADKYIKIADAAQKCFKDLNTNKFRVTCLTVCTFVVIASVIACAILLPVSAAVFATALAVTAIVTLALGIKLHSDSKRLIQEKNNFYEAAFNIEKEIDSAVGFQLRQVLGNSIVFKEREDFDQKWQNFIRGDADLKKIQNSLNTWTTEFRSIHGFSHIYNTVVWNTPFLAKTGSTEDITIKRLKTFLSKVHNELKMETFVENINQLQRSLAAPTNDEDIDVDDLFDSTISMTILQASLNREFPSELYKNYIANLK